MTVMICKKCRRKYSDIEYPTEHDCVEIQIAKFIIELYWG
jgi:hypothetical protein